MHTMRECELLISLLTYSICTKAYPGRSSFLFLVDDYSCVGLADYLTESGVSPFEEPVFINRLVT